MMKTVTTLFIMFIASTTLIGCTPANTTEEVQEAALSKASTISVSKEEFGIKWPVSVNKGELECINGYDAVLHSEGSTYALNGNARQKAKKGIYHDVEEIWLDNPEIPGAKKDISVLLKIAVDKLCTF